ncbi:MAG: PilZ domain-containing protein [Nitrospira sp.]|nr:PilZ domain-containing protein [Nitrospira sp.]MDH4242707.1 PilZ domain-containing protein [Nitrospira sp.]MDH4355024.1 PilZ domain-containing protein [Nitrospira sp.]MDH5316990.1 PilZ domain-containing protein [Nitrospira sp.]
MSTVPRISGDCVLIRRLFRMHPEPLASSSIMPFVLRHHSRFPIFTPVRYEVRLRDGYGTVTNLSPRGWRIHGNVPMQPGDVCSMKVRLDARNWVAISAGIVRWVRGDECGIETLVMNDESEEQLRDYIQERIKAL